MILNLDDKEICESSTSVAVSLEFLDVKDWAFVDAAPTSSKLNISNASGSVKSLRSAWALAAIFWTCCFKKRARCRFRRRNTVASASRSCWLKKIVISSFYCIVESLSSSALRWRDFSLRRIFSSKLSECDVWASISSSPSDISFKIRLVWSDIANYASGPSLRKMKRLKL